MKIMQYTVIKHVVRPHVADAPEMTLMVHHPKSTASLDRWSRVTSNAVMTELKIAIGVGRLLVEFSRKVWVERRLLLSRCQVFRSFEVDSSFLPIDRDGINVIEFKV